MLLHILKIENYSKCWLFEYIYVLYMYMYTCMLKHYSEHERKKEDIHVYTQMHIHVHVCMHIKRRRGILFDMGAIIIPLKRKTEKFSTKQLRSLIFLIISSLLFFSKISVCVYNTIIFQTLYMYSIYHPIPQQLFLDVGYLYHAIEKTCTLQKVLLSCDVFFTNVPKKFCFLVVSV